MKIWFHLLFIVLPFSIFAKTKLTEAQLVKQTIESQFPGVQIKELENREPYLFTWELIIQQDNDHKNKMKGKFPQKIYLHHRSIKSPTVFVTEGYNSRLRIYEATDMLSANQISVEYRYCGDSKPAKLEWKLLNHQQALEDLHKIRMAMGVIYKKNWVVTGISKGGTTSALYSLTYPQDVKATIAYVAPFPLAQEDKRTIEHYKKKVGTPECREKVFNFQRTMLQRRDSLLILLDQLSKSENVNFSIGLDKTIDFASVEFPFSFWQWGANCSEIPTYNSSTQEVFEYIEQVVDFNFYDDKTCAEFLPAYYQFMTEYGYYNFDTTGLSDLLINKTLSNLEFCPKDVPIRYQGSYMRNMNQKAIHESKNIIYIYGEVDTWTSCGVVPSAKTNAIRLVKQGGGHRTRIRDFNDEEKSLVYKSLKKWTKSKVKPLTT